MHLLRCTAGGTTFFLATTLLDRQRYRAPDLLKLYHARWGIEELCKTAEQGLRLEQFRGRSERLVRQELQAHCTLIALTRLFAHLGEEAARARPPGTAGELPAQPAQLLGKTLQRILDRIGRSRPRWRPGRAYARRSRQPARKWRNRKATATPA